MANNSSNNQWKKYLGMGFTLLFHFTAYIGVGLFVDKKWQTYPFGLFSGFAVTIGVVGYELYKISKDV